jgi:acetolactate synthase-1/2/3 large subunit
MVSGGGMMYLSDGIAAHPHLKAVCHHHEQAAAMAAVAYAKYKESIGVCYVTTGCGGTNAVTGLLGAWQDNTPCLFISGQAPTKETVRWSGLPLRQFGVQEADIIPVVESLTKYAIMVERPMEIALHLEKAVQLATTGRPGPVWLDIPLDVQNAEIDPDALMHYRGNAAVPAPGQDALGDVWEALSKAKRPVIVAGHGIRLAGAIRDLSLFAVKSDIPIVTPFLGADLLPSDYARFIGRIGNKGTTAGNLALKNADVVLAIGTRLSVSSIGYGYDGIDKAAKLIVVDIDPAEHGKNTVKINRFVHSDAKAFLIGINALPALSCPPAWGERCTEWKAKYPVFRPEQRDSTDGINVYHFLDCLSRAMHDDAVVVADAGSAFYATARALPIRSDQRLILSGGQAEMGNTLPAAIGVCYARDRKQVIGITGDGSLQMNIQELQTVVHNHLPIVLFVWNNGGYLSIRSTQRRYFGRFIGTDKTNGVSFPDLEAIAGAYGIEYLRIQDGRFMENDIVEALSHEDAIIVEVMCQPDQEIVPKENVE